MGSESDKTLLCVSVSCNFLQPALGRGPSWPANSSLLHHGPPWAVGQQLPSPWSFPCSAGESWPWSWECLIPLFLLWPWYVQVCTGLFLSFFSHSHSWFLKNIITEALEVLLELNCVLQKIHWIWLYQMQLVVPGMGQPLSSFLRYHPWTAATANTWTNKPNTKAGNKDHSSTTESVEEFSLFQRGQAYDRAFLIPIALFLGLIT